jgi:hypothetical protein
MSEERKRPYKRLTPAVWAEIRALWETGETTLAELSDRYGVRTRTLQAHFEKHGTKKAAKAKEIAAVVAAEIHAAMTFDTESRVQLGKEAQAAAYNNAVIIERLVMAQLEVAQKTPENAFKAATAIKTLSLAAQALERLHGMKKSALGLDQLPPSDDMLPVLEIVDLTEDEIVRLQARDEDDEFDMDDDSEQDAEQDEAAQIERDGGRLFRPNCAG